MPSFNYRTIVMWVLLGRAWVTTSSGSPLFTLLLNPHPKLCVQAAGNAGGLGPRQGHLKAKELVKPRVEGGLGSERGRDLFLQSPANLIWSHSSILSFEGTFVLWCIVSIATRKSVPARGQLCHWFLPVAAQVGSGLVCFRADLSSSGSLPPFLLLLPTLSAREGRAR